MKPDDRNNYDWFVLAMVFITVICYIIAWGVLIYT